MNVNVSVVMPCLNAGGYLEKAIGSVFAQRTTLPYSIELVLVDDGSIDATTLATINRLKGESRARVIRNASPRGVSAARNAAIRASSGEFIAFLDADDLWEPWHLQTHLDLHRSRDLAFSVTDYARIDESGRITGEHCLWSSDLKGPLLNAALSGQDAGVLHRPVGLFVEACPAWLGAVVARRAAFERHGLFNETLPVAEDVEMWIRLCVDSDVAFSRSQTAMYRRNSASLTTTMAEARRDLHSARMFEGLLRRTELGDLRQQIRKVASADYLSAAYHCRTDGKRLMALGCVLRALRLSPGDRDAQKELLKALVAR